MLRIDRAPGFGYDYDPHSVMELSHKAHGARGKVFVRSEEMVTVVESVYDLEDDIDAATGGVRHPRDRYVHVQRRAGDELWIDAKLRTSLLSPVTSARRWPAHTDVDAHFALLAVTRCTIRLGDEVTLDPRERRQPVIRSSYDDTDLLVCYSCFGRD